MEYISYNMGKRDLPDIYARALGPAALGLGHIYQANPSCPCYNYYIYVCIYMYMYVVYKPRLLGVFNKYMPLVLGHQKFTTDKPSPNRAVVYIYKLWLIGEHNKYMPLVLGHQKFTTDKPSPNRAVVYIYI